MDFDIADIKIIPAEYLEIEEYGEGATRTPDLLMLRDFDVITIYNRTCDHNNGKFMLNTKFQNVYFMGGNSTHPLVNIITHNIVKSLGKI